MSEIIPHPAHNTSTMNTRIQVQQHNHCSLHIRYSYILYTRAFSLQSPRLAPPQIMLTQQARIPRLVDNTRSLLFHSVLPTPPPLIGNRSIRHVLPVQLLLNAVAHPLRSIGSRTVMRLKYTLHDNGNVPSCARLLRVGLQHVLLR